MGTFCFKCDEGDVTSQRYTPHIISDMCSAAALYVTFHVLHLSLSMFPLNIGAFFSYISLFLLLFYVLIKICLKTCLKTHASLTSVNYTFIQSKVMIHFNQNSEPFYNLCKFEMLDVSKSRKNANKYCIDSLFECFVMCWYFCIKSKPTAVKHCVLKWHLQDMAVVKWDLIWMHI